MAGQDAVHRRPGRKPRRNAGQAHAVRPHPRTARQTGKTALPPVLPHGRLAGHERPPASCFRHAATLGGNGPAARPVDGRRCQDSAGGSAGHHRPRCLHRRSRSARSRWTADQSAESEPAGERGRTERDLAAEPAADVRGGVPAVGGRAQPGTPVRRAAARGGRCAGRRRASVRDAPHHRRRRLHDRPGSPGRRLSGHRPVRVRPLRPARPVQPDRAAAGAVHQAVCSRGRAAVHSDPPPSGRVPWRPPLGAAHRRRPPRAARPGADQRRGWRRGDPAPRAGRVAGGALQARPAGPHRARPDRRRPVRRRSRLHYR